MAAGAVTPVATGGEAATVFRTRRARGFTLVELLVVVAIIAVLAGLLFPVFAGARARAYQSACVSNLRQLGHAFAQYLDTWDGTFPNSWQDHASPYGELTHSWWDQQIDSFVRSDGVFHCPLNDVESYSVHQPFDARGRKTRVVNYALNNQLLGCQAGGFPFDYSAAPADPVVVSRVTDPTSTILLTEKKLDRQGHSPNGPDQRGNQSQEVDVWFHLVEPGLDPGTWDLSWGVPRRLHGLRSNYLFVDGHVRSLLLRQTFESATEKRGPEGEGPEPPAPPQVFVPGDSSLTGGGLKTDQQQEQPLGMWGLGPERPAQSP